MGWPALRGVNRWLAGCAVLFFLLAVAATWRTYSPVPEGDMLDGCLDFYVKLPQQGWQAFWLQHNEHRIPLAKLLFWIDLRFFQGRAIFLLVCNFVLAGLGFLVLRCALQRRLPASEPRTGLGLLIFILLFSFIQSQNFTWGFQVQFFLAQLLPLAAFYLLYRADQAGQGGRALFVLACLTGILAVGTMADGILALPLMLIMAVALRWSWWRIGSLLLLALLVPWFYLQGYVSSGGLGHLREALGGHPLLYLQYVTLYLGGPVFFMTGKGSDALAELAGLFLVVSWLHLVLARWRHPPPDALQLALLTFLGYLLVSALMVAGGRWQEGLDSARASRYMTPALMAWASLIILQAPWLARKLEEKPGRQWWLLVVAVLLLPVQLSALTDNHKVYQRELGALALVMGVRDAREIDFIYPSVEAGLQLVRAPLALGLSAFGMAPYHDASLLVGTVQRRLPQQACWGRVAGYLTIPGASGYVFVVGEMMAAGRRPQSIQIVDASDTVVGYALPGGPSPNARQAYGPLVGRGAGFAGYVQQAAAVGGRLTLRGMQPDCDLTQAVRPLPDGERANFLR